jgi:small subunit ribosomal protein S21
MKDDGATRRMQQRRGRARGSGKEYGKLNLTCVLFGDSLGGAQHKWGKLLMCPIGAGLGVMSLAEVRLQEGESLENALRRFKRKVQTEDIIKEVKRHSFYLKPGEKRRAKEALARKRARKKSRKEQD